MPIAIKKAMDLKELTVHRVAEILEVSDQAVRNWIADNGRPDPENARRLITLLGLTWDEIYPPLKKVSNG